MLTSDSLGGGLWAVYDFAARNDGPVRSRIRTLSESGEAPEVRDQAAAMLALIEQTAQPLTENASFEEGQGVAADHWSWWVKWGTGTMRRTNEVAHSGEYSVLCEGMKRGGPVQAVAVTPGAYGAACFVYTPEGQQSSGTVELALTLRDAKGENLRSPSTKITPPSGRWTALAIADHVPEEVDGKPVASVLPILIVDGFKPDEKVYLDDLMLYRMGD